MLLICFPFPYSFFSSCLERDGKRPHCAQQIATKETKRRKEGDISRRPKMKKNDKVETNLMINETHTHKHTHIQRSHETRANNIAFFFNRPFIHFDTHTHTHTHQTFYDRQRLRRRKQQFSAKEITSSTASRRKAGTAAGKALKNLLIVEDFDSPSGFLLFIFFYLSVAPWRKTPKMAGS